MHSLAGAGEVSVRGFARLCTTERKSTRLPQAQRTNLGGMRGNAVASEVICVIAAGGCHRVLG